MRTRRGMPSAPFGITSTSLTNARNSSKNLPCPVQIYIDCEKFSKKQNSGSLLNVITRHVFIPQEWANYFHNEYANDVNRRRALLKIVQVGTICAMFRGRYQYIDPSTTIDATTHANWSEQEYGDINDEEEQREEEAVDDNSVLKDVSLVQLSKKVLLQSIKSSKFVRFEQSNQPSKYAVTKKKKSKSRRIQDDSDSDDDDSQQPLENIKTYKTVIQVIKGDCLELALHIKKNLKCNPAMLIMASQSHPGGGYRKGSSAQEEDICRRTNLFMCLEDPYLLDEERSWGYPLPEYGGVYVPTCIVARESSKNGYAFLKEPQSMSMIVSCAYANPPVESKGDSICFGPKLAKCVTRKMECILQMALDNGHDSVVLSALGCGAYANPPRHVAELFKRVISGKFEGRFKYIFFGIYDDRNAHNNDPLGNVHHFAKVFHGSDDAPTMQEFQFDNVK